MILLNMVSMYIVWIDKRVIPIKIKKIFKYIILFIVFIEIKTVINIFILIQIVILIYILFLTIMMFKIIIQIYHYFIVMGILHIFDISIHTFFTTCIFLLTVIEITIATIIMQICIIIFMVTFFFLENEKVHAHAMIFRLVFFDND